ncbi:MAG: hypothetical protein ABI053_08740 [Lacisediminihabitans sp.]
MAIRRQHLAVVIAVASAILLAACASQRVAEEPTETPMPAKSTQQPTPTVRPTADAASMAAAQARLDSAAVPAQATAQSVKPDAVAEKLNMKPFCDPQAVAVGFWTVPAMSVTELMDWLRANPSPGMGVSSTSGPVEGAAGSIHDGIVTETVGGMPADNGLVFSIAPTADGVAFRADAIVIPADATCPEPVPGVSWALGG